MRAASSSSNGSCEHEPHVGEAVDHRAEGARRVAGVDVVERQALVLHPLDRGVGVVDEAAPDLLADGEQLVVERGDLLDDGEQLGVLLVGGEVAVVGPRDAPQELVLEAVERRRLDGPVRLTVLAHLALEVDGDLTEDVLLGLEVAVEVPCAVPARVAMSATLVARNCFSANTAAAASTSAARVCCPRRVVGIIMGRHLDRWWRRGHDGAPSTRSPARAASTAARRARRGSRRSGRRRRRPRGRPRAWHRRAGRGRGRGRPRRRRARPGRRSSESVTVMATPALAAAARSEATSSSGVSGAVRTTTPATGR